MDTTRLAGVVALERLTDCRAPERFGGWLLEIVRNRALNYVRSRAVGPPLGSTPSRRRGQRVRELWRRPRN